ncbi:MAG: DNA mismatch repair protein [Alphaproteobacteria bacterium]|nr:DNA mismatch repair protein [Alphaproteobacteria bacterium]
MSNVNFSGSAQITDEGIKKHFKNFEPFQAIYELIWNGLDANAKTIKIQVKRNDLDGLSAVFVIDDGEGIDVKNTKNNFEKFNESSKKNDDNKHGSHGRGRFGFHKLSAVAIWFTRREGYDAQILINSDGIKDFEAAFIPKDEQHESIKVLDTGTCVELRNFYDKGLPENDVLLGLLGKEFGWYLALNKSINIFLNDEPVVIPSHELKERTFVIDEHDFDVKVIRWDEKPSSEKSYNYLVNSKGRVCQKELSKFNNKFKFHTSAYVSSVWVDGYDPDLLELDTRKSEQTKTYNNIMSKVLDFQKEIYNDFLRRYVDEEIEKYDSKGYFPKYKGVDGSYAKWRKEHTKTILKDLYIADPTIFNSLNQKQSKILIRLLDAVLVSNENDAFFDVLDGVLELDEDKMSLLAKQLKTTTMESIVSTIETLQKRQVAVHKLKDIMESRYKEVLETPDLQKIIENNTWLFGPQYTILGSEEDTFTNIAKNLRDSVRDMNVVSDSDIDDGALIEGVNRQVDLFLARKVATYNSSGEQIYKCVVIEIKRPGVSLNKKHLQQLEDYAEIISKHAAFTSDKMSFELILVGRKISKDDYHISNRLKNMKDKGEYGLVSDGKIKCYVKDWFTIFDEFELSNNYLLSTLNTKLEDLTEEKTANLVEELQ